MLSFGKRPRELSWFHAGPMLFGDWGTSRLYVLGLAFAATGYGSFAYIAAMGVLLLIVAWAYTVICRAYPEGGGVYAAGRERTPVLGVVGGLLLFADYVVTAALSALAAFLYLDVERPEVWALCSVLVLGGVHYFGPKKAGVLALWIAAVAFVGYLVVAGFSLRHLGEGAARVVAPTGTVREHWTRFVHIVLALSGVEAVANMTGIMVQPIRRTSLLTIWPVALEVVGLNLLLILAVCALPVPLDVLQGDQGKNHMLRVLAESYVGPGFASAVSVLFALLLLSASSTAITGMLGIEFAMARDGELPRGLGRLNRYGVPLWSLAFAVLAPVLVLSVLNDLDSLADLYAIGVVGAITLNCYATATSKREGIGRRSRWGLLAVAVVMAGVWATVATEKTHALIFAGVVVGSGLLARVAFRQFRLRVRPVEKAPFPAGAPRILVASRGDTWVVDRGLERASEIGAAVVVALIREAAFVVGGAAGPAVPDPSMDPEAARLFEYARRQAHERNIPLRTLYQVSTTPMSILADHAVTLGCDEIHVGGSRRGRVEKVLRGSPLDELQTMLPDDEVKMVIHLAPTSHSPAG